MKFRLLSALFLAAALPAFGQTAPDAGPGLPKEPAEVFAMAAPYYDFSSPTLKPWHLKATYQLYDDTGNSVEQGTYEYWWASPQVYRSTWSRSNGVHTVWHTVDGKQSFLNTGEALKFPEYDLPTALFSPLPTAAELDSAKFRLERELIGPKDSKSPCIMVIPRMPQRGQPQPVQLGLFPTYCFDAKLPALMSRSSFGSVGMQFGRVTKVQNRFLARDVAFFDGAHVRLSATVDSVTALSPDDPLLMPTAVATAPETERVSLSADLAVGRLIKKQLPAYPEDAKDAHATGTVLLRAIIGTDGRIHDLHVVSAPWPSLAAASLQAVSQWEYKPYLLNGKPVEVETTINAIFNLGH
jgi:TonB family protein